MNEAALDSEVSKQSKSELNMFVPSFPGTMKVVDSVDGAMSTVGGSPLSNQSDGTRSGHVKTSLTDSVNKMDAVFKLLYHER